MRKNIILTLIILFYFSTLSIFGQLKIAILPFSNLDGNFDFNKYCYEIQDSLTKAFAEIDPNSKHIIVIPVSAVDDALSNLNIDANSPSFDVDKWKVLEELSCDRVISGTFRIAGNRFLINSYIYYPDTRLSDQQFQAKDIFKKEEKILESVATIVKQLSKAFMQE